MAKKVSIPETSHLERIIFHDVEQGTPEWDAVRRGKFTGSNFSDLFMKETTATYEKAIYKVVFEKLTDESPENFKSEYMKRGNELEPEARKWYEDTFSKQVMTVGFLELKETNGESWVGVSPDGLVDSDGMIEIKCPAYNTMINYLMSKSLPSAYKWQVQGQLYVAEREWVDFVPYHPKLQKMPLRVYRDEAAINELKLKLNESIDKAKVILEKIKAAA